MSIRNHVIKIATPKLTKTEEDALRSRLRGVEDPALYKLSKAYNNIKYVYSKVPQIEITKFNTTTYTVDFILEGCLITDKTTEYLISAIKKLNVARKNLYDKLLPLVVPKLGSPNLDYLRATMEPAAHTRLRYCLAGCYKVKRDIPNIKFTSIDINNQIVSFILKNQAYTLPLNNLLSLSIQAKEGS